MKKKTAIAAKNHKDTAKSHMVTHVSRASADDTVGQVLDRIQNQETSFDTVDYTYVLDAAGVLKGSVSIKELLNANNDQRIGSLMKHKMGVAHLTTDQETVANLALKYNIKAVPIVDSAHHFLGVLPSDAIINVLQWEHSEDMLKLSGVRGRGENFHALLKAGAFKMAQLRIPSLLIGLVGGLMATSIVEFFEGSLEEHIVLAFFIPLIVYINNAVGTQTQTILVRTLALEDVAIAKYVLRELSIGLIIGSVISVSIFVITFVWFRDSAVALTIGLSILVGSSVATILGLGVPYVLHKMKKDPAISGGPFATILQDILSLLIYFSVATVILK